MTVITGTCAAGGIGIGRAFVLPEDSGPPIPRRRLARADLGAEWARFIAARDAVAAELSQSLSAEGTSAEQKEILGSHLLMLSDAVFIQELKEYFTKASVNIELALRQKVTEYADMLRGSGSPSFAERAEDIEDTFNRVLNVLLDYSPRDLSAVPEGAVLASPRLSASDAAILMQRKLAAVVLTEGSASCHVAILAKGSGIPVIVGIEDVAERIHTGDTVIVDASAGEVIVDPDTATIVSATATLAAREKEDLSLRRNSQTPAQTEDGTVFRLYANITMPEECEAALAYGADGIGLFRTEFLFMNAAYSRAAPASRSSAFMSEEEQFRAYKSVLEVMKDKPVTIRTLDVGGDKVLKSSDLHDFAERNPLMGLRAIRLSLYYPAIFRTQLRALYRASVYGNLRIMLPLITDVSQLNTALGIASGVRIALKEEGVPFKPDVPIGIMVETAAAAICADVLARHSAFFSLGTNDLTQYVLGVDRENRAVSPLYNEFNLAVLRMIRNTILNAQKYKIPLSVCGEMAGNKESAVILAGLGVRDLSMPPRQIPVIKETLSRFSITELENLSKNSVF